MPDIQKAMYKGNHPVFSCLKRIFRVFVRRPRVIDLGGHEDVPSLFVSNHSGARSPFMLGLFFPHSFAPWGAHPMCGSYRERRDYLYHTFYRRKLKWHNPQAFIMAHAFALVSGMLYKGADVIPAYEGTRLRKTLELSAALLANGRNVLVFPEDSAEGYREQPDEYLPGFVALARLYRRKTGHDVPIRPVCCSAEKNVILIGKPVFLEILERELGTAHLADIADHVRHLANGLCKGCPNQA